MFLSPCHCDNVRRCLLDGCVQFIGRALDTSGSETNGNNLAGVFYFFPQYKERLVRAFTEEALPHFSRGASPRLQPLVDSVYALQDIAKAHRAMEENRNIGKIIIEIPAFVKKGPRQ